MKLSSRVVVLTVGLYGIAGHLHACPYCEQRPLYWAGVFNDDFFKILAAVGVPLLALFAVGFLFLRVDSKAARDAVESGAPFYRRGPLMAGGVLVGIGMGGYIDGIFLHMILQWHHLISNWLPPTSFVPLEVNMFWDGVFSLGMWTLVLAGLITIWKASLRADAMWSGQLLVGSAFIGWGIFNMADSIAFHWVLRLHHIYEGHRYWMWWDIGFLLWGIGFVTLGLWMASRKRVSHVSPPLRQQS